MPTVCREAKTDFSRMHEQLSTRDSEKHACRKRKRVIHRHTWSASAQETQAWCQLSDDLHVSAEIQVTSWLPYSVHRGRRKIWKEIIHRPKRQSDVWWSGHSVDIQTQQKAPCLSALYPWKNLQVAVIHCGGTNGQHLFLHHVCPKKNFNSRANSLK